MAVSVFSLGAIGATAAGMQTLHGHVPEAIAHATPAGRVPAAQQLRLAIALPLRNREALDALLADIYNPASPNYRHYLTPDEFAKEFGPAPDDYDAVKNWAAKNGLKVTETHPNRVILDVAGASADVEKALHVTMHVYHHPKEARDFFAPDAEPSLDLGVQIAHISGLDNYSLPQPRLKPKDLTNHTAVPNIGSGPSGAFASADFRAAYVPGSTLTGTGQSVGLLQFDGYSASDISYYLTYNHLPTVTISNVLLDGFNGAPSGTGGEVEVCLDIEMVVSMAPGVSKIYMYEAGPSGLWHDILNRMATDNTCKQISCSWYSPSGTMDVVADGIFQQMAAQGQTFFSASGDYDAFCGLIPFPGDTPYITQVGGTLLTNSGPAGSYLVERAWNRDNGIGSGGGISTQYSIPTWQQGISMIPNNGSTTMRNVPDVALTADGVYVRADGIDQTIGGTSAAAPLWAGFFALVNQRAAANSRPPVGFANPQFYAIGTGAGFTSAFHDITIGNNTNTTCGSTRYPAVTGYDLATGWGSPTGEGMITALAGPADALQISPITGFSATGPAGGPFDVTSQDFSLTNSGNSTLSWTLINTSLWLRASISSGTIAPGAAPTTVTVGLNLAASNLVAGNYTNFVIFSNTTTTVAQSRQFNLLVLGAPVITNQPANAVSFLGNTAHFNVGAYGVQPLSYQWRFNGGTITNATNSTLNISGVTLANAGTYSVVVSNSIGTVTSANAVLTVDTNPRVAIFGAESASWNADVKAKIVATGLLLDADIDVFDPSTTTPTLATLQQYAAVLTWSDASFLDATGFGNVLADYVDAGGGLVVGAYAFNTTGNGLAGRIVTGGYLPISQAALAVDTAHLTIVKDVAAHPIMQNVNTFDGATYSRRHSSIITAGSTQLAHWSDGRPLVAIRNRVVALNFRPTSTDVNTFGWQSGTDGGVIMANSLMYAAVNNSPPIISTQPSSQTISLGSTATFSVVAFGGQPLNYQWQNNGAPISGATASAYSITNVQFSDVASYSVIVTNSYGSATSSAAVLTIDTTPVTIITQPLSQTVSAGNATVFSVNVTGAVPRSYQWQKNGGVIAGAMNSSFTLFNTQPADAGSYSVVVTNLYGAATSLNATLTVLTFPPSVVTQPANQVAPAGGGATFSVYATGTPPLTYSWKRGGVPIAGATSSTYSTNNVQLADSGAQFSCVISNAYGSTTSSNATLTVLDVSGIVGYYTDNSPTDTGLQGPITRVGFLAVQVTNISTFNLNGVGMLLIDEFDNNVISAALLARLSEIQTWTSNGGKLIIHDRSAGDVSPNPFLLGTTGITTVRSTTSDIDVIPPTNNLVVSGPYGTINNTNLDGGSSSAHGYVPAGQLPLNTTSFISMGAAPSNVVCFSYPLGQGMVYYSSIPLDCYLSTGGCSGSTIAPTLQNIYTPNVLVYAAAFSVCSNCPPTVTGQPTNQVVPIGGSAMFSVNAGGTQPLSYQWRNNGAPISGATTTTYSIINVQFSDAASYSVVVSNAFGTATSSNAILTIDTTPPSITSSPVSLTVAAGSTATFSANAAGAPTLMYQWEKNAAVVAGATSKIFSITNTQPTDAGTYSVVVTNAYGTATSLGATLTVLTYPPTIAIQPANRTVSLGGTATFSVSATGTAPLSYLWQHGGAPIAGATTSALTVANVQLADAGSYSVIVTNAYGSATSSPAILSLLGLDHFSWNTISSPQQASNAFSVTISARDSAGVLYTPFSGVVDLSANVNAGGTIEDFESGVWPHSPWNFTSVSGTLATTYAHDGVYGLSDPEWAYRTDVVVGNPGDSLSWWVRPGSGRAYLGFGASASGCWSIVAAQNTGTLIIQQNSGYSFTDVATVSQAWTLNHWYKVAVQFVSSSSVTCSLYDSDGSTLLNTVSYSSITGLPGGIAMRSIGAFSLDTIATGNGGTPGSVPITPIISGSFVNGTWIGNVAVLQGATNVILRADDGASHSGLSNPFNVAGPVAPTITSQPTNMVAVVGSNALFTVSATGTAPLSYQWSQNGSSLLGATNSSLAITNVQTTNAGTYTVVVANPFGSATSSNALLSVISSPVILTQPTNQIAFVNGSASFNVRAIGAAPLSYFWQRGGVPIAGATTSSYSITNLQVGDSGAQFSCLVSNAYGTLLSSNALLTVLNVNGIVGYFTDNNSAATGPQGPITHAGFTAIQITDIASFNLNSVGILFIDEYNNGAITSALQGRLANIQTWTSNGGKLIVHDRSTGLLSPNPFLLGTIGITSVRATVSDVDVIPPTNNLVVSGPFGTINNTNLDGGSSSAHGYVPANQLPIGAASFISLGGAPSNVVCFSYPLGQGMVYYSSIPLDCYLAAGDCAGSVIASTLQNIYTPNVLVYAANFVYCSNCPPVINSQPANQTVAIGGTATFTVSASGPQPLGYQWQNNGAPISGATAATYSIVNVQLSDVASYSVVVTNAFGSVTSSSALLTIDTTPPSITGQPVSQAVYSNSPVTFTVTAAGAPPLNYQWRKNGGNISGATASSYSIGSVQGTDAGSYSVIITNLYGSATSSSAVLTVSTSMVAVITFDEIPTPVVNGYVTVSNGYFNLNWTNFAALNAVTYTTPSGYQNGMISASNVAFNVSALPTSISSTNPFTLVSAYLTSAWTDNLPFVALGYRNGVLVYNQTNVLRTNVSLITFNFTDVTEVDIPGTASQFAMDNLTIAMGPIPPSIVTQPSNQIASVGGTANFSVVAGGSRPLTYQWQNNGAPISAATNSTYSIINAQLSDAASYSVVVSNAFGTVTSSNAVLNVGYAPSIATQPASQTVIQSNSVSFSVVANGSNPLAYQWYINGATLANATASTLTVTNAQPANAGTYAVVVTNLFGSVTSANAALEVDVLPVITGQPASLTAGVGTTVTFSASVTEGAALPSVSTGTLRLWLKGDMGVVTNASGQVSQWLDQSGNGNNATQTNSSLQPLLVKPAGINGMGAVRFDGNPSASLGDYLQGNGDVGLSNAYTSFLFYQLSSASNSKQVPSIVGIGTVSGNCRGYFIYNQEMRFGAYNYDFGNGFIVPLNTYRIATHRLSTNESLFEQFDTTAATTSGFSLAPYGLVVPPPGYTVGSLPSQAMSFAGDIAELIYYRGSLSETDRLAVQQYLRQKYYGAAGGISAFHYQWQFDGANIPGATNSSLVITNVQFSNAGTYDLVVSNLAGTVTSTNVTLTVVAYPPSIVTQPLNSTVNAGSSASFSVSATGTAPLSYFWQRGGVPIAGATSSSYTTNNVQLADSGAQFSCVVSNAYGTATSSNATLTVVAFPPTIVTQPANRTVAVGGSATFSVSATGTAPLSYFWRRGGVPIAGATSSVYITNNVQLADSGALFSCLVSNAYGTQLSSGAILTVTSPPGSTIISQNNTTVTLDNTSGRIYSVVFRGIEIYRAGTYISDWGLQTGTNSTTFVRNENNTGSTGQPMNEVSATSTSASFTGTYTAGGANVALARSYVLLPGTDLMRISQTFQNNGASAITLRCFDTFDPDWSSGGILQYWMAASRYTVVSNGVSIQVGRGVLTNDNTTVLLATQDPSAVLAASLTYFGILNSTSLNSFFASGGGNSGGAIVDETLDIGRESVIAPGASTSFVFYHSMGTNAAAAEAAVTSHVAALPIFSSISCSGNNLNFSWASMPGNVYQLQYKSNLTQPNWSIYGTYTASSASVAVSDLLGAGQRYYRVMQLP